MSSQQQNPFVATLQRLAASQPKPWIHACNVILIVCCALWLVASVANIASLAIRIYRGERWLFKLEGSRLGTFVVPNVVLLWPGLQIVFSGFLIYCSVVLIKEVGYGMPYMHGSFSLQEAMFQTIFFTTYMLCHSSVATACLAYANRIDSHRSRWYRLVGPALSVWAIVFFGTFGVVPIYYLVKSGQAYEKAVAIQDTVIAQLQAGAATYVPGTDPSAKMGPIGAMIGQMVALYGESIHLTSNELKANWGRFAVLLLMWPPAAAFQFIGYRREIRNLQASRRVISGSAPQPSTDVFSTTSNITEPKPFSNSVSRDPVQHIKRLERLCMNIVLSLSVFIVILIIQILLVIAVWVHLHKLEIAKLNLDRFAAIVTFTFGLVPVDFFLLYRALLSHKVAYGTSIISSSFPRLNGSPRRPANGLTSAIRVDLEKYETDDDIDAEIKTINHLPPIPVVTLTHQQ